MVTTLISVNETEFGIPYVFSIGRNMQNFTEISIEFTKPDGTILLVSDPDVTVPAVSIFTVLGLFAANTYAQYAFQEGDLDQYGTWTARLIYTDASPLHLTSNRSNFTVNQVISGNPPSGTAITTEDGFELITEDGEVIVTEGA